MLYTLNHQTPAVIKSLNTSSVTDVAVGQYSPIMTTSYSDANYIMTNSNNFDVNTEAFVSMQGVNYIL